MRTRLLFFLKQKLFSRFFVKISGLAEFLKSQCQSLPFAGCHCKLRFREKNPIYSCESTLILSQQHSPVFDHGKTPAQVTPFKTQLKPGAKSFRCRLKDIAQKILEMSVKWSESTLNPTNYAKSSLRRKCRAARISGNNVGLFRSSKGALEDLLKI